MLGREAIRLWGDPVLRAPAAPVRVFDGGLAAEANRLVTLLDAAGGAGLAAPQAGRLCRLFVYHRPGDDGSGSAVVVVNPEIVARSSELSTFAEGCLSMPGLYAEVTRPSAVTMRAQDLDGATLTIDAEGPHASLLQHELDHLDGVLLPDRLIGDERRRYLRAIVAAQRAGWPAPRAAARLPA